MRFVMDWLSVSLQRILPRHLLTSLVHRLARVRNERVKNILIRQFVRAFDVHVEEARHTVPDGYATFNAFFIRELADGCRPIDADDDTIVSPADGTVSAAGRITANRVFQAKGLDYSLEDLLATDLDDAQRFIDGAFATIYLAPYNYHRVHAPLAGRVRALRYVPGDLFSVNDKTVRRLSRLFARNERVVLHVETAFGPMAVIFVGALNVGSISTPWSGEIRPRKKGVVDDIDVRGSDVSAEVARGATLGWFNMGSTVIVLLPAGTSDEFAGLAPGMAVQVGRPIGRMTASGA